MEEVTRLDRPLHVCSHGILTHAQKEKRVEILAVSHLGLSDGQSLVKKGATVVWLKIKKGCKISILSITRKQKKPKRIKNAVKAPVYEEFAIGGFKASRTSEFEIK